MKLSRLIFPVLLMAAVLTGCGKSPKGPEITMADLETTNAAPQAAGTTLFIAKSGSKVRIDGTANIFHTRWQVESAFIGGQLEAGANFPFATNQSVAPGKVMAKVDAFIPVRSLKSVEDGKHYSDKMDEIMYEKLKAVENPKARITYHLNDLELKAMPTNRAAADAAYVFDARGQLAVAGVTNTISMPVAVTLLADNKLRITGATSVKMSEFKIEPPTVNLVVGKIVTGDEVKISFEWLLAPRAPDSQPVAAAAAKQSP